ncbi:hypothetical protein CES86_3423 [Brucella lupini]|uniref:Uncharacterized protein n=1 Tax=Brucella lupini TaxID=255457 RepID=A0A256GJ03_9HYPH|nr:hypothetical protein CES86_3423 [Brucella lupini]
MRMNAIDLHAGSFSSTNCHLAAIFISLWTLPLSAYGCSGEKEKPFQSCFQACNHSFCAEILIFSDL